MTEKAPQSSFVGKKDVEDDFSDILPKSVGDEDSLSRSTSAKIWGKMYATAGLRSPNEKEQRAFRLACYVYAAKNGTSREGLYKAEITMANGHIFNSSVIPECAGKMEIRKFFRTNMDESYDLLKKTKAMENEPRFIAKAAGFGISQDTAFAMADWLTGCSKMTPSEEQAHNKSFAYSVDRARRARDGHTLESVESHRLKEDLAAQGDFSGRDLSSTF